jgi:hypothetical protein
MAHKMDLEASQELDRKIVQIALILFRQDHALHTGPSRGKEFFANASDRKDPAREREFSRHGGLCPCGNPREE